MTLNDIQTHGVSALPSYIHVTVANLLLLELGRALCVYICFVCVVFDYR